MHGPVAVSDTRVTDAPGLVAPAARRAPTMANATQRMPVPMPTAPPHRSDARACYIRLPAKRAASFCFANASVTQSTKTRVLRGTKVRDA